MKRHGLIVVVGLMLGMGGATVSHAQEPAAGSVEQRDIQKLELSAGKSKVLDLPVAIKRASLANPEVADTVVLSPTQIYLTGKAIGVTNLTLWNENGKVSGMYDVVVVPDLSRLKENLHKVLPEEQGIRVTANSDRITLSGTASSATNLTRALEIAEAYAPKKVINSMQVGGVQQVMLEVRVAEMNRELIRRLGVNFAYIGPDSFGISVLNNLTTLEEFTQVGPTATFINQAVTQSINGIFGFNTGSLSWTGFVDALKEQNLVKVLAKPTLVALNGQEAAFLAGGEFPIPVPQAFGVVTIQFKKFGVGLVFTPNVLNGKHISMNVAPEVSELDFQNALRFQGFTIPAITTRRASTTIELGDGQSFAIGGLMRDNVRESVKKFPVLGELPIVGTLFRSTAFQKNETELLIIVTPHLVRPLDMTPQTLPTDYYVEPNDFEFFLLGLAEKGGFGGKVGQKSPAAEVLSNRVGGGNMLEGQFGHMMP
ncbi:MAG TPA: type II and III secretion system protein family protein [Nitrospiraceae bacterium]|nr:type II and III secretion system protein family protein [Nitrospiraceae bacterium]